ncbi:uncharacterized protein LOC117287381 [Fukomys damarensis]|uniref:uncharacterized protein LOC117287381 n=1 Tax=Fukomys damarensis TaxID=885580 RepID=UPI001455B283|nr:uncharacterized protein LOC117287381 [Fukomys damarensis]
MRPALGPGLVGSCCSLCTGTVRVPGASASFADLLACLPNVPQGGGLAHGRLSSCWMRLTGCVGALGQDFCSLQVSMEGWEMLVSSPLTAPVLDQPSDLEHPLLVPGGSGGVWLRSWALSCLWEVRRPQGRRGLEEACGPRQPSGDCKRGNPHFCRGMVGNKLQTVRRALCPHASQSDTSAASLCVCAQGEKFRLSLCRGLEVGQPAQGIWPATCHSASSWCPVSWGLGQTCMGWMHSAPPGQGEDRDLARAGEGWGGPGAQFRPCEGLAVSILGPTPVLRAALGTFHWGQVLEVQDRSEKSSSQETPLPPAESALCHPASQKSLEDQCVWLSSVSFWSSLKRSHEGSIP